jgi:hypothetical protein
VAEAQGHPYSPTLWAVAHGLPAEDAHYAEERLVLDFQRFCNGGAVTDAVRRMPPGLRERALRLLRPAS